jgi:hypothetical protein
MPVTRRSSDDIRSSRQRMQAGQSPSVVKSAQQTGETVRKKQREEHLSTAQPKYIDSGPVVLRP